MNDSLDIAAPRAWIDDRAARHEFSGVVLITDACGTVFEHAAGMAHRGHRVANTVATKFAIASAGKMVTAATALRLVEEGMLTLDRPLIETLPAEYRPAGIDERHTLHHLLSNTSGLSNYFDEDDETWDSFTDALATIPASRARGPLDVLPLFLDLPPTGTFGEYVYCDANFVLIGVLIESATGRSFAELAREKVLTPAGMANSDLSEVDLEPEGFATGYLVTDEPPDRWRSNLYGLTASAMPDGGMTATAHDLDGFMTSLRSGLVLAPETVSMMARPYGMSANGVEGYGYGMHLVMDGNRVLIQGHDGGDPGVLAQVWHYIEQGITLTILCNQDRGAWPVLQEMVRTLGLHDPRV